MVMMSPAFLLRVLRLRRRLRSHERWSRRDLELHQAGALRTLRDFATARSPFYQRLHRGLGSRPLGELPVVTKQMVMESFDELVTDRAVRRAEVEAYLALEGDARFLDRYWVSSTSGTTGLRGLFLSDLDEWTTILASYARAYEWAGIAAGLTHRVRTAVVSSLIPWHQSARVGAMIHSRFVPTLRLDATMPTEELVARLNAFAPQALIGYASMLGSLAQEQLEGRLRISPTAVLSASEVLTDEVRARARRAFGVAPFNVYAATEPAGIASECEEHRLHLYEDLVITEVVDEDNRPVPPGQAGAKVLVTVLFSRTQPLIRYEMSDTIALSTDVCPCGRTFALLGGIEGRREDVLLMSGETGEVQIHPNVFHRALEGVAATAWQVVQEPRGVRILLAGTGSDFQPAPLIQAVTRALTDAGARSPEVQVERVVAIPKTRIGKAPLVKRL
jgi:phenylacetate-CoA ligase